MSVPVNSGLRRGSAAVVGAAESDLGHVADGLNVIDLMAQGIARAAEDAGLKIRDIDGLFGATTQARTSGLSMSVYLGISPRYIDTTILGGSSFMFHVAHAVAALQLGLCEVALVTSHTAGDPEPEAPHRWAAEKLGRSFDLFA